MPRLTLLFIVLIGGSGCFASSQPEPVQTDVEIGSLAVLAATSTVPPTAAPPTAIPPTDIPPTQIPPTAVPPTAIPPTSIPPTAIPPTAVPPTLLTAPTPIPEMAATNRSAEQPNQQPAEQSAEQSAVANADTANFIAEGQASRISDNFQGDLMANGQPYNKDALLAAHKELPFGTVVRVTNLNTGLTVDVTITDRIPQTTRQVIDVSRAAAVALGMPDMGVAPVRIEVVP